MEVNTERIFQKTNVNNFVETQTLHDYFIYNLLTQL